MKELREARNLTQAQLAQEFQVSKQTVSAWEKNLQETDFTMLVNIARYFQVSVDDLLGVEN